MIKAVIFDLDGTLANTMEDLAKSMNSMLSTFEYPLKTEIELICNINCGAWEFVKKSLPIDVQNDDDIVKKCYEVYSDFYSKYYNDKTYLYDGIYEAVQYIKEQGYKLCVLSNKQHEFTKALVYRLFSENIFDIVMGHSEFLHKPDPQAALFIAQKLGFNPNEVAFIGDSNVDIETAINANMYPIGVSWGFREVDVLLKAGAKIIINSSNELKKLFSKGW